MKVESLDKMKITSSESKYNLGGSGKGLINSLGIKAKTRPRNYIKARYAIGNFSKKDPSKIIREFENYLMKFRRKRGPNMSLLKVNFTQQDSFLSVL